MMKLRRTPPSGTSRYLSALANTVLGLIALAASTTGLATVSAQLERTTVQDGDTVTLRIERDGVQSRDHPDVSALSKDFEVLGTTSSSETRIVNGSRSDRTRWLVQLQPRHPGTIDIAPIAVGNEHTAALVLNVTKASPQATREASKHVFLQIEATGGNSIYVQQQIPYTVRLYYDGTVQEGDLPAPAPANAIVQQLGEEARYTAVRDGREYNVIERHYAIAPEQSGTLHIPSPRFRGSMVIPRASGSGPQPTDDLMSRFLRNTPFANDPFFKSGLAAGTIFGEPRRPVTARGQEITYSVQPRPTGSQGTWLPAEQITLHDSWQDSTPQLKVGEPVTRTITVNAKGLAAAQIPPLSVAQPANARVYPESPQNQSRTDGKTIFGISKQNVTYIPNAQGTLTVPPIELPWWNTRTNTQSRAVLPARQFKIAAGAVGGQAVASPTMPATGTLKAAPTAPKTTPAPPPERIRSLTERLLNHRALLGGGAALLVASVVLGVILRRSRRSASPFPREAAGPNAVPQRKVALRMLQQACDSNDANAAKNALLYLARTEWPDDPPLGLAALGARLAEGETEVRALDRSLYAADAPHWDGAALWAVLGRGLQSKRSETPRAQDGLGALYP